ncbi:uncharacterized protein [Apostichopus japonicus]|uniref:uncharacterized protein n=1 Tax=Stichopus japonicus TaxID=307972 RepID=UPI003AB63E83
MRMDLDIGKTSYFFNFPKEQLLLDFYTRNDRGLWSTAATFTQADATPVSVAPPQDVYVQLVLAGPIPEAGYPTYLLLSFSPSTDVVDDYLYEFSIAGGPTTSEVISANGPFTWEFTPLNIPANQPQLTIDHRLVSRRNGVEGPAATIQIVTQDSVPPSPPPVEGSFQAVGTRTAIRWGVDATADYTSFVVFVYSPGDTTAMRIDLELSRTSYFFNFPVESLLLDFYTRNDLGLWSTTATFTQADATPVAVADTLFQISQLTETTMTLEWQHKPDTNIIQYIITITDPADPAQLITKTIDACATAEMFSELFQNLTPATGYSLQIDAIQDGNIIPQPYVGPEVVYTRPFPPELAVITQTGLDSIRFEWTPPTTGNFDGYVVVLNSDNKNQTYLDSNTMFFDVSGLQADVAHDFGVYTYVGPTDQQIWSDLGPTDFVPIADVDGNVQIDSITSSSLNVLWDAYQNAMANLITLVDENNQVVGLQQLDGTATQFSFTGLDPSTFYEARVKVFIDNQAFYAGESNASTLPVGTPSGVVNVQSTTTDAITVDFTEIPGATSYQIIYTDNLGVTRTLTSFAGSPFTIPNLSASTDYNIQVNSIVQGATELVGNAQGRTEKEERKKGRRRKGKKRGKKKRRKERKKGKRK